MANLNPALKSICQYVYRRTPSAIWMTQNNESAILNQPARRSACQFVYLELWVLFVERRTIEAQFSAPQPEIDPKKWLNMELIRDRYGTIKVQCSAKPARKSACQFVYRGSLGAICRTQNNRGSIFSPPGREPAIQKVPKYGMRDPHMLYKISCPYFIKVHVYNVLLVCRNTFISLARPDCTNFLV
jgi:hypothetical protein